MTKVQKVENTSGVYLIVSSINGAHYVGGSIKYRSRIQWHHSRIRRKIHLYTKEFLPALKANKLTFFLLEKCTVENLHEREQYWMDQFPLRVNKSPSVHCVGFKHSLETRKKMSKALIGNTRTLGYKHTLEFRKNMSVRLVGNKHTLGYKHTPEACKKMSASRIGNQNSLGYKHTSLTKEKLQLAYWRRNMEAWM